MTREEIRQEAEERVNRCTPYHTGSFIHGYIAGAESREQKIEELEQQIEKLKADLDNARESANRQEQWEIYSVLNDLYNDNFGITKGISN